MPTALGTAELARRVTAILEATSRGFGALGGTGSVVDSILSWLQREELTLAEVMEVLAHLRRSGHLARFLNLVSHRDLRRYLRDKQVPWHFVLQYWEPSVNDSGNFFAGFLIGAGETVTELLRLLVAIVGSPFSKELAQERDKFWESVKFLLSDEFRELLRRFAGSPAEVAKLGLEAFSRDVEQKLWNLEFFEAGRTLGKALAALLLVVQALRRLPAVLQAIHKIAREVAELTLAQLKQLGVPLKRLQDFLTSPAVQAVTPEGFVFAKAADEVVLLDRAARPLGKIATSKALQQLSGSAGQTAPVVSPALKGFQALSGAARQFLDRHDLLGLARSVLAKASIQHLDNLVEAINRFHACQGFEKVAGLWLRGARGSSQLAKNMEKGASFVMRYCLANLSDLPPWAIVFETRVARLFRRFTDVLIPGLKLECKSVAGYSPKIAKQLARDVITNLGRDLERLKGIRFVFDKDALQVSKQQLLSDLKRALREMKEFSGHPRVQEIEGLLDKIVEVWPP